MKNRSRITNLIIAENDIAEALNKHKPVDFIAFNISSAFDRVPHQLLLHELGKQSIIGILLDWIVSFLLERTQSVRFGVWSPPVPITSGVIHSSILGPAL